ncbi:PREDICTED: uncharacterized protein LOC105368404 [Ceratosolen solmsi marchali]|uniref:Uncharacterized protein LOC105368404 n=1 Tax=Ceratosolen solmsi marchali TaxID=326594 RepID=A0AAJ6YWN1_9HYME|nr:PREDICTED: uncharacterized protein LOC105368404 [Ceratosolen solmsi marchali]
MYKIVEIFVVIILIAVSNGSIWNFENFQNYSKIFGLSPNESNNELWHGILKDCSKKITFSCIQKNAYNYLQQTFDDRDKITVFDGFSLTRNNLDYDSCIKDNSKCNVGKNTDELHEKPISDNDVNDNNIEEDRAMEHEEAIENEHLSPLEEITNAMRSKTVRFLATRDYQIQLPSFLGEGVSLQISPREIDSSGALIRVDFNSQEISKQQQGRLFLKKIKKQIQNKLLVVFLVLILLIKIIKLKFMFVIPFLFGIGTAKKLFLKLLLFFVPAFAHVFKLCSSYYSSHATKYHHHHHKIAHHHHHIPVPVPVSYTKPVYYDHPPPHSHILEDDFPGYDYAHPHIQYRKDIEELKEWGIEPYDESYDQIAPQSGVIYPGPTPPTNPNLLPKFGNTFGIPPSSFPINSKPMSSSGVSDKLPPLHLHSQNLAYSGYGPSLPAPIPSPGRQPVSVNSLPVGVVVSSAFSSTKHPSVQPGKQQGFSNSNDFFIQQQQQPRPVFNQQRHDQKPSMSQVRVSKYCKYVRLCLNVNIFLLKILAVALPSHKPYDDDFYGPIIERLDEIFSQLKFLEESCRERLVCNMYKNPTLYSPHSNLVSNELSRDPQELQQVNSISGSSQRFLRYLNAARLGQDGGDCLRAFNCSSSNKIN